MHSHAGAWEREKTQRRLRSSGIALKYQFLLVLIYIPSGASQKIFPSRGKITGMYHIYITLEVL
ncbi:MAG: hypothetical protein OQK98_01980, partial [Gammaproteobacteria bacterium]|nr:hypothetical protein [Gammaproteobacteria bacterium]